ncbi:MAG: nitrous oxide reductase family maturation protein NosD [Gemmatimonadetes bacterium]|nr:nitrous oxide reductase family maturation protein NosD [Gemmatimonadota bacterium]
MLLFAALLAVQGPLVVAPDGPYRSIAAAVAAAPDGGTVRVTAGVWRGPLLQLDRPVTLVGDAGAILDGEGSHEIVLVRAPYVTLRGLTFRNTGRSYHEDRAAVHVDSAASCLIEHNRFDDTFFAIYLAQTEGCVVRRNVVTGRPSTETATGNAIHSWGSRNLTIEDNQVSGHRDGIYLEFTRHAAVRRNVSEQNFRYGLHFMYSDSSAYEGNTFRQNGSGVAVMYSHVVRMASNRFLANRGATAYGLLLKEIADVTLIGNDFTGNTTGLLADGAERLEASGNRFTGNGWAVRLLASTSGGRFTDNHFAGNSFDVAVNARTVDAEFVGNWWDAYRGWDLDHDGTGDVPHHPVRLFALLVERAPAALMLQRALFIRVLDAAERVVPALTPAQVVDRAPRVSRSRGSE